MNASAVTAAILVTMGRESLYRLLDALPSEVRPVVVANGCPPEALARLRARLANCGDLVELPVNRGGSGGFNAGVHFALEESGCDYRYLWLLDDDAMIYPDTGRELTAAAEALERAGKRWAAVGAMMLAEENPEQVIETGASVNFRNGLFRPNNRGARAAEIGAEPIPADYCSAASLLVNPAAVREAGFFADIFLHYDDVEWGYRVRKLGFGIWCAPKARATHPTNLVNPATWVRYYDAANLIWFAGTISPGKKRWMTLLMTCRALYFALWGLPLTARLYLAGIRDGRRGTKRIPREQLAVEPWSTPKPFADYRTFGVALSQEAADAIRATWGKSTPVLLVRGGKLARLFSVFRLWWWELRYRKRTMVADDDLRNRVLPPPLFHAPIHFNFRLNRIILPMQIG